MSENSFSQLARSLDKIGLPHSAELSFTQTCSHLLVFPGDVTHRAVVGLLVAWFAASLTTYILLMYHARLPSELHLAKVRQELPPLSVIIPVSGYEDGMDDCIRSYFNQIYPAPIEIVFALSDSKDPALNVAKAIRAEYPNVSATFVVSLPQDPLANPKLANVIAAFEYASHDLIVQSDSNTIAPSNHCATLVSDFITTNASLVFSYVEGSQQGGSAAKLWRLHLATIVLPSIRISFKLFDFQAVLGKSFVFSRREIMQLDVLPTLSHSLCEDFLLGRLLARNGKLVTMSPTAFVQHHSPGATLSTFLSRNLRWLTMARLVNPLAPLVHVLCYPTLPLLFLAAYTDTLLSYCLVALMFLIKAWCDLVLFSHSQCEPNNARSLLIPILRDIIMWVLTAYSIANRTVVWRGRRFRLNRNTTIAGAD